MRAERQVRITSPLLAVGQEWQAADGSRRTVLRLHPSSRHTEGAVQLRIGEKQIITVKTVTMRVWIRRHTAVLLVNEVSKPGRSP